MKAKILTVDDRPENLLALRAILDSLPCEIIEAHSGMQALKHLLNHEFALILMDVQMPGLDGFETASLIKERERSRHIPIIFVTAISKEQNYIFQGYSAGAVDYIPKPFNPDILRSKVAVFIELWQKSEQVKRQGELERRNEHLEKERQLAQIELELKQKHLAEIAHSKVELERFKATLDATLDGVSIFEAHSFRYSYVNQGALHQLGYSRDEMLLKTPFEIKPEFDEKSYRRLLKPLEDGQKDSLTFETLHQHKDGTQFPVEVFLQYFAPPLGSPPGTSGGFISIVRDITERKRAHELLVLAKETAELEHLKAERANRAKSDFIAGISHELRTPLNAILGFSKLLLNPRIGPLNEDQHAYTNDVVQSAEHLLQLINDILDLSKIEAGKMTLEREGFCVADLLQQSLIVVREGATARDLALSVEVSPDVQNLPPLIGDARKVKQVMYNLLSNAVKFTGEGGQIAISAALEPPELPTITQAAREKEKQSGQKQLFISVRDTGVGIAEEHQKRIFSAFEQVDNSYTRQQQGTGLGLTLTRRIVELHGGGIWLHSQVGQGSTFVFSLPIQEESASDGESVGQVKEKNEGENEGETANVAPVAPSQKPRRTIRKAPSRSKDGITPSGKRPVVKARATQEVKP